MNEYNMKYGEYRQRHDEMPRRVPLTINKFSINKPKREMIKAHLYKLILVGARNRNEKFMRKSSIFTFFMNWLFPPVNICRLRHIHTQLQSHRCVVVGCSPPCTVHLVFNDPCVARSFNRWKLMWHSFTYPLCPYHLQRSFSSFCAANVYVCQNNATANHQKQIACSHM